MLEKWKHLLDNGYHIGVLMELSKAFDILNHFLLLTKLDASEFPLKSTTFIQNYLNKRMHKVIVNNKFSAWRIFIGACHRAQFLAHSFSLMIFSSFWLLAICVITLMIKLYLLIAEISTNFRNTWIKDFEVQVNWFYDNYMVLNPCKF